MVRQILVKPIEESLAYILDNKCSVARFGDGEMDIVAGHSIPYQEYDAELAANLREIMGLESDDNFLVCLSDVFEGRDRYNHNFSFFWDGHLERFGHLYDEICQAPWYGSTFISRPYIDLEDKAPAAHSFALLKQIWADKDILIVEGETSRSGVGNDLFAQAKSISRIICPSKNAYARYEDIASAIRQHGKDKLVLLMLGPTAKVLSYNLSKEGYWTIDLGHIDSEYEWFQMGATYKVKLDHKHTAEHNYDQDITFREDKEYEGQIVQRIGLRRLVFAVAADDGYASHLGTLFYSLVKHHPHYDIVVYVLHQSFTATTIHYLEQVEQVLEGLSVELVPVETTLFDGISLGNTHLSVATFYRLLLPELLVNEDRVIYLDVDVLVVDSLVPIWEWPMANQALAGVKEEYIYTHKQSHLEQIGLDTSCDYFNAGVLVMNLAFFREQEVSADLLDFAVKHANQFPLFDQDVLNCYFQNSLSLLDKKYNYHNDFLMTRDYMSEEKAIIHYGGSELTKPWTNDSKVYDYIKSATKIYRQYREEFLHQLSNFYPSVTAMVAVPTESRQHWLEGLDSLLLQTYPNLQINLLCHPEDYDELLVLVKQAQGESRIHMYTTQQDALSDITSEFIYFANILDVLEKDCISNLMVLQDQHQAELVVGDYYTFRPDDGLLYFHAHRDAAEVGAGELISDGAWMEQLEGKLFMSSLLEGQNLPDLADLRQLTRVVMSPKQDYLLRAGERQSYRDLYHLSLPMVSVVIAAYNVGPYLEECLDSVLKQTYTNWEVVLVNDGSTDETGAIADRYAAEDSRFRVFHRENGGASVAKNYGINQAVGEFITLLDSDDVLYEKDMFQVLLKQGRQHQADIVIGNYFEFDEGDGNFYYRNLDGDFVIEEVSAQEAINRQANWGKLNTSAFIITAGKLIRRRLFEGLSFPIGRVFDDEYLTHKLYMKAKHILLVNGNYYLYRRRKNSIMHSGFSITRVQDVMYVFQDKLTDLVLAGYDTHEIRLRYRNVLNEYKGFLEYHGMTDTSEYESICFKLSLITE